MADGVLQRVQAIVAKELDLNRDEIGPDSDMLNVPSWDSMGQLNICMAVEQEFGKVFDLDSLVTATSIKDIATLVEKGTS